jgi:hypothetical protein
LLVVASLRGASRGEERRHSGGAGDGQIEDSTDDRRLLDERDQAQETTALRTIQDIEPTPTSRSATARPRRSPEGEGGNVRFINAAQHWPRARDRAQCRSTRGTPGRPATVGKRLLGDV